MFEKTGLVRGLGQNNTKRTKTITTCQSLHPRLPGTKKPANMFPAAFPEAFPEDDRPTIPAARVSDGRGALGKPYRGGTRIRPLRNPAPSIIFLKNQTIAAGCRNRVRPSAPSSRIRPRRFPRRSFAPKTLQNRRFYGVFRFWAKGFPSSPPVVRGGPPDAAATNRGIVSWRRRPWFRLF